LVRSGARARRPRGAERVNMWRRRIVSLINSRRTTTFVRDVAQPVADHPIRVAMVHVPIHVAPSRRSRREGPVLPWTPRIWAAVGTGLSSTCGDSPSGHGDGLGIREVRGRESRAAAASAATATADEERERNRRRKRAPRPSSIDHGPCLTLQRYRQRHPRSALPSTPCGPPGRTTLRESGIWDRTVAL